MVANTWDHIDHVYPVYLVYSTTSYNMGVISDIKWDSQFLEEVDWSRVDVDPIINYTKLQWLQWFCEAGGSPDEARLEQTPYPFQPH